MNENKEIRPCDGKLQRKIGHTTYNIRVYFDHETEVTAEDKVKRLIVGELKKGA